ncbi:hypothetical protein H5187_11165 [Pseudoalteromonas sp. SG44-1]|uniref:hypothetical protein n=1 Tax=Pseudoalteromonas sp. SG44-1 TaxID=2760964 RepID=UPI001601CCBA|nr:hypothetical protein [Pseudoalteromonas sp. SG44-1]MBB1417842.1 hypothetical protein [Pseudoalteromonas sp. SG44-1]
MLILKYVYKDAREELPFELSEFEGVEDASEIDEWDLLNWVASKVTQTVVELSQPMYAVPRGGKRGEKENIAEIAHQFGFRALVLIDKNESKPVVFIL